MSHFDDVTEPAILRGRPRIKAMPENEIVKAKPVTPAIGWNEQEVRVLKEQIAPKATDAEMNLFLYTARMRDLNPLLNEIYCIHRKSKEGDTWVQKMTIQVSIGGLLKVANRTKKLKGIERGVKYDNAGNVTHGWAKIWVKGWDQPVYEEVPLSEYFQDTTIWRTKKETMIKKCALAAALRIALPEDLGGLYTGDEMPEPEPAAGVSQYQVLQGSGAFDDYQESQEQSEKQEIYEKSCQAVIASITKMISANKLTVANVQAATGFASIKDLDAITDNLNALTQVSNDLANWIQHKPSYEAVS